MNNENKIGLLVLAAVIIGIVIGGVLIQNVSAEVKEGIKNLDASMKGIDSSIKGVDSSLKDVKTGLVEKETGEFRREMQESGRRILSLSYAGKFARWDTTKKEADELDKTLQSAANLRPDLAQSIAGFRSTYIPKLKGAANEKNTTNFETVWGDTYNACIACHRSAAAPPEAADVLGEIKAEVEWHIYEGS